MRTRYVLALFLVLSGVAGLAGTAQGQQSSTEARKLVRKVDPVYPPMARKINLAGTVKVFAIVAIDGTVKSVEPVGGSPVLVQAAQDAIRQWKFAPAAAESKELVELHFHPE
jgi:TonB family protein